ncbi:MAG: SH3 domain-containing protein, partial [Robiginitalea sp.]
MQFGICSLSIVPVYESPDEASDMVIQLLYGEVFKVLESRKHWSRIRSHLDQSEGWIRNTQLQKIGEAEYRELADAIADGCAADLISHITTEEGLLLPVPLGASVAGARLLSHQHEGDIFPSQMKKEDMVQTALMFLNSP